MARPRGIKQRHPLGSVASRSGVSPLSVVSASSVTNQTGVKISQLPPASVGTTTDQFEVNQGGVSRRLTLEQIRDLVSPEISVGDFGAVGDGVTDDTAALQAAIDAAHAAGGGVVDCSGGRYLVDSADLNLKYGVTLSGFWKNFVKLPSLDYSQVQSCIVINPLYTIRVMEWMCSIVGLVILRKGIETPTDIRTALDQLKAYDGVGVTVGNGIVGDTGSDFYIGYTTIGGFTKALYVNGCSRPHVEWVNFDCTNGIDIRQCYDMDHVAHCHGWGFLQAHGAWNFTSWTIANVTNNGGLIRITTTTPHALVTGDNQAFCSEVVGVPNANNAYTVTVINSTTVDLQGSAFGGAYVSGGKLWAGDVRRLGSAYYFDTVDWLQAHTIFEFGWNQGIYCFQCNTISLLNIGCDNFASALVPQSYGLMLVNCYEASVVQATLTSQAIGCYVNNTSNTMATFSEIKFAANHYYTIQIVTGDTTWTNCRSDARGPIRVESGAQTPVFIGGNFTGVATDLAVGAPTPRFVQVVGHGNYVDTLTTPGDINAVNVTATGTVTGDFSDATSMFRRHGADTGVASLFAGVTRGIRFGFDAASSHIEGVDNTGVGSFQPLFLHGSEVAISSAPLSVAAVNYLGVATGSVNAMTVTGSTFISALTVAAVYTVKANLANTTTTPTININGTGARTIVKRVSTALAAGDYLANQFIQLMYDGTNMVLLNPVVN